MPKATISLEDLYTYLSKEVFPYTPKGKDKQVGFETEMILFSREFSSLHYYKPRRCHYLKQKEILCRELPAKGWLIDYEDTDKFENLKSFKKNGAMLTFEGGGQLEYSSSPCGDIDELQKEAIDVQGELEEIFKKENIILTQMGTDPWNNKDEIGIQKKSERYELMSSYFRKDPEIKFTRNLLQATSLQVCLDLGTNEETLVKRYLGGVLIAPFATAIFANSPYYVGRKTKFQSYRTQLWREHDPSRTGFPKNMPQLIKSMKRESCIENYLNFSLDCPLVFYRENGKNKINEQGLTFRQWLTESNTSSPDLTDYEHALTLLFPEVRVKGYLEFRSIDNQPQEIQMIPIAFYCGLLYDTKSLDETMDILSHLAPKLDAFMLKARQGLQDKEIMDIATKLIELALDGFSRLAQKKTEKDVLKQMQEFNKLYTSQGKTPANTLLNYLTKRLNPPQAFSFL